MLRDCPQLTGAVGFDTDRVNFPPFSSSVVSLWRSCADWFTRSFSLFVGCLAAAAWFVASLSSSFADDDDDAVGAGLGLVPNCWNTGLGCAAGDSSPFDSADKKSSSSGGWLLLSKYSNCCCKTGGSCWCGTVKRTS